MNIEPSVRRYIVLILSICSFFRSSSIYVFAIAKHSIYFRFAKIRYLPCISRQDKLKNILFDLNKPEAHARVIEAERLDDATRAERSVAVDLIG